LDVRFTLFRAKLANERRALARSRDTPAVTSTPPADGTTVLDPIPVTRCAARVLNYLAANPASFGADIRLLSSFVYAYRFVRHINYLTPARKSSSFFLSRGAISLMPEYQDYEQRPWLV
jgi:hypothetical protein